MKLLIGGIGGYLLAVALMRGVKVAGLALVVGVAGYVLGVFLDPPSGPQPPTTRPA